MTKRTITDHRSATSASASTPEARRSAKTADNTPILECSVSAPPDRSYEHIATTQGGVPGFGLGDGLGSDPCHFASKIKEDPAC